MTNKEAFDIVDKRLGLEVCRPCIKRECKNCEIYIACMKLKECVEKGSERREENDSADNRKANIIF